MIKTFPDYLGQGHNSSLANICAAVYSNLYPIEESPFTNRLIDNGVFSYLGDAFISPIKPSSYNDLYLVNNFLYRGTLQGAKYLPNLLVKCLVDDNFPTTPDPSKTFIKTHLSMLLFFTTAAIETKIPESYKWPYVVAITSISIAAPHFYTFKVGKEIITSQMLFSADMGLTISFVAVDLFYAIGVNGDNLWEAKPPISKPLILAGLTIASLGLSCSKGGVFGVAIEITRMAAFTLSKGVAATMVDLFFDPIITMEDYYPEINGDVHHSIPIE